MYRLILIILFLGMSMGFRLLSRHTWAISETSPTLWVRMCPDLQNQFFDNNDLPSSDPLAGTNLSVADGLASIRADFNNVNSSYLRLAPYPADPQNPGAPDAGDNAFTLDLARVRTIDICISSPTNPFQGGEARPRFEGDRIVGCNIQMNRKILKEAKAFMSTLTHEIGHCIGLDHPQETKYSIMSYFRTKTNYRLMIDDKMGIVFQYPKAGVKVKETPTLGLSCAKN
jgi:hypothetical protein